MFKVLFVVLFAGVVVFSSTCFFFVRPDEARYTYNGGNAARKRLPSIHFITTSNSPDGKTPHLVHPFFNSEAGLLADWDSRQNRIVQSGTALRLPQEDIDRIVAGKRLLFIGESILRYLFLAVMRSAESSLQLDQDLVELSSNQWLAKYASADLQVGGRPQGALTGRNLFWQKEWSDWMQFLNGSTDAFNSRMCCDCYRSPQPDVARMNSKKAKRATVRHWAGQKENRFYEHPQKGLEASFYFMHGKYGGHGSHANHRACAGPSASPSGNNWAGLPSDLGKALLSRNLTFDAVIVNSGLWFPWWRNDAKYMRDLLAELSQLLLQSGGRTRPTGIWLSTVAACEKTPADRVSEDMILHELTTASRAHGVHWKHYDMAALTEQHWRQTRDLLFNVSDPRSLTAAQRAQFCSRAYVDYIGHLQPYQYKEYSHGLLRLLV